MEPIFPQLKLLLECRSQLETEASLTLHRLTESLHSGAWRHLRSAAREQRQYARTHPCREAVLLQALCPFLSPKDAEPIDKLCRTLNLLAAGERLKKELKCGDLFTAEQGTERDTDPLLALLLCMMWAEE